MCFGLANFIMSREYPSRVRKVVRFDIGSVNFEVSIENSLLHYDRTIFLQNFISP